ncbi:cystathionine gamma-synthase family protein [Caldivirga maquilingensis]|uniref:Cystathionine gamma-synthase n=1 Tax=Caldivirga maquilingensis (strain ATCC 700844 / DSM 13496 / JCM 10307 / IC-167) TaxID=397948 RepID=A8M8X1_CALMQ|nr:cystathionine gamma-synthase family protein [Caldivirga maquilingensis]ABW02190.1 Cystathionine gamma-synthase [Caldivirga maquilingensis IC-167]
MGNATDSIHGHDHVDEYGSVIPPIYLSTPFRQIIEANPSDRGFDLKYSREENPTVRYLEHVLAKLEKGVDALATNNGMAAVSTALISILKSGSRLILPAEIYGTTLGLAINMDKFNVRTIITMPETEDLAEAIKSNPNSIILIETLTNPMLRVIDVDYLVKVSKDNDSLLIVDNTMATPILYRPIEHGVGIVIHSATKYISGHNDVLAGAIVAGEANVIEEMWQWRRRLGTIIQPLDAYLALRGVKTMSLRVRKHCENAMIIADYLSNHSKIKEVYYPGLKSSPYHELASRMFNGLYGGIVSFKVKGDKEGVRVFLNSLKIIKPAPSFGGPESLIMYPITSAAQPIPEEYKAKLGIDESLLRLSVGLEDVEDIINDLDNALRQIP